MLAHAIDNPAPTTIVLISGDRDFAYALSILRLRCYHVVLITLSNAHQSLRAQASTSFDWASDVLEPATLESLSSYQPTSPRRGKISSPPAHDKLHSDPTNHNSSRSSYQESCDEKSASSVNSEYMNDEMKCTEKSRTPANLQETRGDSLPPYLEKQQVASSVAPDPLRKGPESSARVIHSPVISSYFNGSIETPLATPAYESNVSGTPLMQNTSVANTPRIETYGNAMPSRSSVHSAQSLRESAANSPNLAASAVLKPMSIESAMQMLHAERESSQQQNSHPPINATRGIPSVNQTADLSPGPPSISRPANVTATPSTYILPSFMPLSSLTSATASAIAQLSVNPSPRRPIPLLDQFRILIHCLKTHRSRGNLRPLRSKISSEIAHNDTTYRLAGFSDFDEYVAMAEKEGVVELGGSGLPMNAWISLKAPWYNARLS